MSQNNRVDSFLEQSSADSSVAEKDGPAAEKASSGIDDNEPQRGKDDQNPC